MKINLNAKATVTLTQTGADMHRVWDHQWEGYTWWKPKDYKAGDVVSMQLWQLFQIYGKSIHLGMPEVPFENNIIEVAEEA